MANPSPLQGKEIVLGVTASIAAYKSAELVRRFKDAGASVTCVMTPSAERFIGALTLAALSGRPVASDPFDQRLWSMAHLALAKTAHAVLVAPCTADALARFATGEADTLLGALLLATRAPVFLAPAMHEPMWTHPATQHNVERCRAYGYRMLGPVEGALASGDHGLGRLEACETLVADVAAALRSA